MHELGVQQCLAIFPEITSLANQHDPAVCGRKPAMRRGGRLSDPTLDADNDLADQVF